MNCCAAQRVNCWRNPKQPAGSVSDSQESCYNFCPLGGRRTPDFWHLSLYVLGNLFLNTSRKHEKWDAINFDFFPVFLPLYMLGMNEWSDAVEGILTAFYSCVHYENNLINHCASWECMSGFTLVTLSASLAVLGELLFLNEMPK